MTTLICGSMAYDTIMVFHDRFKHHILPDQLHILNVSFLVPDMRREFGGCAGNIAYSLKLLEGEPLVMATVGQDFQPYANRLDALGLARTHVTEVPESFTAQAFITTDLDDNQITAFHPGAMMQSHRNSVADAKGVELGIVSPDGRDGMLQHAREFHEAGIPFVFDPGQGLPMFNGDEVKAFIAKAAYVTVNDYEARLVEEKTGETVESLSRRVKAFIVTRGGSGSTVWQDGKSVDIPSVTPEAVVDPTGCGDAYRGGILYGIVNGLDWALTGRLASLIGSLKIARRGAQNHSFTRDEIATRFKESFGMRLW
ncbi:MAG: carbohydrate kinase family protein [Betaproteobacteria bacterium]|nr:carbohydrate kinase family protein [Betaproteobacteria bacterium]MBL8533292.1 carbohydrate kinase family protein [Betaproteobacteria bacterium]